jgi:hypothetical protein
VGRKRQPTSKELATLEPTMITTSERGRELAERRWNTVRPISLKGEWADLYDTRLAELLEQYGDRGAQYRMLADLAAGLYVQTKRMEATGAIRGIDSWDAVIERLQSEGADPEQLAKAAVAELDSASRAVGMYLKAIEQIRKLVDQAQRYTEARKAEVVMVEVNSALVRALQIVETFVDRNTYVQIVGAVRDAIQA